MSLRHEPAQTQAHPELTHPGPVLGCDVHCYDITRRASLCNARLRHAMLSCATDMLSGKKQGAKTLPSEIKLLQSNRNRAARAERARRRREGRHPRLGPGRAHADPGTQPEA